jgi:hypothetical protein
MRMHAFRGWLTGRFGLHSQPGRFPPLLQPNTAQTLRSNTMGTVTKAGRIDEGLWHRHRPTIERFYIREQKRLEGKGGVHEYMRKHHSFTASYARCLGSTEFILTSRSKSQYENNSKKWGLRKDLTRVEWRRTIQHMKHNSLSGEQVQILFQGAEIS